ncbi:urease accessory protein UreD [Pseudonocardia sp.]|uniref:urease accessory protein UreD n=1 Tax=Pseudonocardia sp. TaxID=60912 RepID=UPI0031FD58AF
MTVHMVGSASTPLAGDDVELDVRVGPGADLVLTGVAAAVALPGLERPSSLTMRFEIGEDASLQYLPEPTVINARAHHRTALSAELHPTARLRAREVLVAGRAGEPTGRYRGTVRVEEAPAGPPERHCRAPGLHESADRTVLLVQTQELGDLPLGRSAAHLGRRVLGTELLICGDDPGSGVAGDWWSLTPLARRGSLATAVGPDAVVAQRGLAEGVAAHPGWTNAVLATAPVLR